ncbi:MAG TPA: hypothetical protein VL026_00170 [Rhizomicrobium sp.]|nr:hypothetical protein [Rhizomicrobium sp.]
MKFLGKYEVVGTEALSLLVIAGAAFLLMGAIAAPDLSSSALQAAKAPLIETAQSAVHAGVS